MTPTVSATTRVVAVLLDSPETALRSSAKELLTLARALGDVVAIALAEPSAQVIADVAAHGVKNVVVVDPGASSYLTPVAAEALTAAVGEVDASIVLLTTSFENREIAALTARSLTAGLMLDCVPEILTDSGRAGAVKQAFAGTWNLRGEFLTDRAVMTVRSNVVADQLMEPVAVELTHLVHTPSVRATAATLLSRTVHEVNATARPVLAEAAYVVAGGRGTQGDFAPIEELADALSAAVGATRDAVDEGWVGHDAQIGQTGVTIAPRLYIGAGISGAPHHRGGMQASETIIAVNSDPETPLFEVADFAVVGDLADVLPQAAAALRARSSSRRGA